MLSFFYEASIKSTISLQELHIDLHELHIGIFVSILLLINYSFDLCSSWLVYSNVEGSHPSAPMVLYFFCLNNELYCEVLRVILAFS